MASYRLQIKASAAKEIAAIAARPERRRIVEKIGKLAVDPRGRGAMKLAGYDNRYRIRLGDYRIIYLMEDADKVVTIFKVGHRKDVYG